MTLPDEFLRNPFAHRGLHDLSKGVPENSRVAFRAAISAGYGIELDVQMSGDGVAMVFHDDNLDRLTASTGRLRSRTAAELSGIQLTGGDENIPTLDEVLKIVDGQSPLLVEIKDQDGKLGADVGPLEKATANCLAAYAGLVAFMSFNPHSVAAMAEFAPDTPRGLVTEAFTQDQWPNVPKPRLDELAKLGDVDRVGACFISHDRRDLKNAHVAALKAQGLAVTCWTVRNRAEEQAARNIADNITFEGYAAPLYRPK